MNKKFLIILSLIYTFKCNTTKSDNDIQYSGVEELDITNSSDFRYIMNISNIDDDNIYFIFKYSLSTSNKNFINNISNIVQFEYCFHKGKNDNCNAITKNVEDTSKIGETTGICYYNIELQKDYTFISLYISLNDSLSFDSATLINYSGSPLTALIAPLVVIIFFTILSILGCCFQKKKPKTQYETFHKSI